MTESERRRDALREQMAAFDRLWAGKVMSHEARAEWEGLQLAWREADRAVAEDRKMRRRLLGMVANNGIRANEPEPPVRVDQPENLRERQRDALRAVERAEREGVLTERAAVNLDGLIRRDDQGSEARYLNAVWDPAYKSAYLRIMAGAMSGGYAGQEMASAGLSESERAAIREVQQAQEERALAVGAGGTGGFAVPADLDPTVILASDGRVNPFRQIARVETISSNEWRGVTSLGVSAAFQAEAEEVGDDTPALLQPTAFPERAAAFVPFSIEIGQDWGQLAAELARMFAEAKDELEVNEFTSGIGHAANKPEGLHTGATAIVSTAAATTLAIGDVYSLKEGLPPRFIPNARVVGNSITFDRLRRLAGPNSAEPPVWDDAGRVLRLPAHENSAMDGTLGSGASILAVGDFSHFLIADRLGMQTELVPHLLGSNRRPTLRGDSSRTGGRRALCWR